MINDWSFRRLSSYLDRSDIQGEADRFVTCSRGGDISPDIIVL